MKRDGETLEQIGILLWGPDWQAPMSEAMGVNDRTIRRCRAGQELADGFWQDLGKIVRERAQLLLILADVIGAGGMQQQVGEPRRPAPRG